MEFYASDQSYLTWSGDCLVIGLTEADLPLSGRLAELDSHVNGLVQELIDEVDFTGKTGTTASTRVGSTIRKLGLVGLGAADTVTSESLRRAAASAARLAKAEKSAQLGLSLPRGSVEPAMAAQAMAEGVMHPGP